MQSLRQVFGWDDFPEPLFYETTFSLRFDLGGDLPAGIGRFLQAIDRARSVAEVLFGGADDLTVAVPYWTRRSNLDPPAGLRRALDEAGFMGVVERCQRMAPRNDDEATLAAQGRWRYLCFLRLPNKEDQILPFLWASIASEMPVRPKIAALAGGHILDLNRGRILYPYDDRGMDVVATDAGVLGSCHEQFNPWLLDYDRPRMDAAIGSWLDLRP